MSRILSAVIGWLTAAGIRTWVRVTGRRVSKREAAWLDGPMGGRGRIGIEVFDRLAGSQRLEVRITPGCGLLPDFASLRGAGFDPGQVCSPVRDFYEHTSCYDLVVWSEAPVPTRFFLWFLIDIRQPPDGSVELPGLLARPRRGHDQRDPADGLALPGSWPTPDGSAGVGRRPGRLRRPLFRAGRPGTHPDPCVKVSFPRPPGQRHGVLPAGGPAGRVLQIDLLRLAVRRPGILSHRRGRPRPLAGAIHPDPPRDVPPVRRSSGDAAHRSPGPVPRDRRISHALQARARPPRPRRRATRVSFRGLHDPDPVTTTEGQVPRERSRPRESGGGFSFCNRCTLGMPARPP